MIEQTFGSLKPIVAMVHFPPLPGSPRYDAKGGMSAIIDSIAADIERLIGGGVDAVMFGNEGDRPYLTKATPETIAAMAAGIQAVRSLVTVPFGVDYLWDPVATVALAAATGARFGREVMTGVYDADMGLWTPDCAAALRLRAQSRLRRPEADVQRQRRVRLARRHAVDRRAGEKRGLLVARRHRPGVGADDRRGGRDLRSPGGQGGRRITPVFANTGVNIDNVGDILGLADGCVIGTHFKVDGDTWKPVDRARVTRFMDHVRRLR